MNERVPIRTDYRMLVNDYDEEKALISPEELCSEDQHLFTHRWTPLHALLPGTQVHKLVLQSLSAADAVLTQLRTIGIGLESCLPSEILSFSVLGSNIKLR
ncbi:hypothetical protein PsorP6_006209 [Peronosclerospora sorghi]|uniref:Uncharacterized protein n=1 Tax=Peronosclerospora sorghi TaxID=230839 RepID=A0ACC0W2D7_9STRA|nr:hypothetical protein PsorP6_006209 [Peronosclerospora sorghi]